MWFIGVEVEQETSAPPPKKNPGSAPGGKEGKGPSLSGFSLSLLPFFALFNTQARKIPPFISVTDVSI